MSWAEFPGSLSDYSNRLKGEEAEALLRNNMMQKYVA